MGLPTISVSSDILSDILPILSSTGAEVIDVSRHDNESTALVATYKCTRESDAVVYIYVLKPHEHISQYTIVLDPRPANLLNRSSNRLLSELKKVLHDR